MESPPDKPAEDALPIKHDQALINQVLANDVLANDPSGLTPEPPAAEPAPEPTPFWGWTDLALVMGLLLALIVAILFATAGVTLLIPSLKSDPTPLLLPAQLAFYAAVYLALSLTFRFRFDSPKPVFRSLGWHRSVSNQTLFLIGLGGALLSPAVSLIASLLHTPEVRMDILDMLQNRPFILAMFGLMAVTVAPLFEELFFRGFLQPLFSRTLGVAGGIALTSILFGSLHAFQYKMVWQYVAAVSLVGAALGIVRYRTGSLIPSTVMHACYNSIAAIGIFFQPHK